jgi:hypothetical protein
MPILQDHYFDPTAVGSNLGARGYGNLAGADVFFYISTSSELRVKQANSSTLSGLSTIQILVTGGVQWLSVIQQPPQGVVHLYWTNTNGAMFYAPYTARNFSEPISPVSLPFSTAYTFSTTYAQHGTPPAYCMLVDDGTRHTLYTSATPDFSTLLGTQVVYNNNTNLAVYINKPVIAVHPLDTNVATVIVQHVDLPSPPGIQKVGFYVTFLPGVS